MTIQTFIKKNIFESNPARLAMIILMLGAGTVWLGYEFWRLLLDSGPIGGIDLKQRYEEAFFWFRGFPIYGVIKTASYPPASYVILWPFVGWMSTTAACWLWGVTSALCLCWLSSIFVKGSLASTTGEKIFVFLIPLSAYATGATIGNGQLIVHVLPVVLASVLFLEKRELPGKTELAASLLFILALVKPSITAPFFWIVLFLPGRIRAVLLIISGYAGLTVLAGLFQDQSLVSLVIGWLESSSAVMGRMAHRYSYSNLHNWLHFLGYDHLTQYISLLLLLLTGAWIRLNRKTDIWILISVAGIIARLWTYHAWYDDLLILPGIITLFRFTKLGGLGEGLKKATTFLVYTSILLLMAPGGHYLLPPPLKDIYLATQAISWLAVLSLLIWFSRMGNPLEEGEKVPEKA